MFLDHASTTSIDKIFLSSIETYASKFANPSSNHADGLEARSFMKAYKKRILDLVNKFYNTEFTHFILTSGATESINTIFNAFYKDEQGCFCLTDDIEHKATLESIEHYCNDKRYSNYKIFSILNPEIPEIKSYRVLLSLMTVNNETGTIVYNENLINTIMNDCKVEEFFIHTDNTQGFMKVKMDLNKCDMMTFSGHKIGTFKGIGGLFLNDRAFKVIKNNPLLVGGNQQEGIRSGTENPLFIYALYQLLLELNWGFNKKSAKIKALKRFVNTTLQDIANDLNLNLHINTMPNSETSDYIINFAFEGIEGESVLTMLGDTSDSLATTSACNSEILESSYVLKALGIPNSIANCALRMSFNDDSLDEVIEFLNGNFKEAIKKLAQLRVRKTK